MEQPLGARSGIVGRGLGVGAAVRPVQDGVGVWSMLPDQGGEQPPDLGHGQWDQFLGGGVGTPLFAPASAVVTVRKACASIAKVMCLYQES